MKHFSGLSPALASASLVLFSALAGPSLTHGEVVGRPRPNSLPTPPTQRPAQGPGAICTATLVVRQTQGASGCFIDERVTRSAGLLRYPCAGGAATARFSTATFAGSVTDGVVDLRLITSFDFSDGCHWRSQQRIHGALGQRRLAFTYNESPVPGQSGCASSCAATADVQIQ